MNKELDLKELHELPIEKGNCYTIKIGSIKLFFDKSIEMPDKFVFTLEGNVIAEVEYRK